MNITAQMVKELRDKTGAGMMDAKKALVEVDGDMDKAMEVLRQKGMASADKKMGRIAAEGLVGSYVDETKGAMVEVNCETDFVAKNAEFKALLEDVLDDSAETTIEDNQTKIEAEASYYTNVADLLNEVTEYAAGKNVEITTLAELAGEELDDVFTDAVDDEYTLTQVLTLTADCVDAGDFNDVKGDIENAIDNIVDSAILENSMIGNYKMAMSAISSAPIPAELTGGKAYFEAVVTAGYENYSLVKDGAIKEGVVLTTDDGVAASEQALADFGGDITDLNEAMGDLIAVVNLGTDMKAKMDEFTSKFITSFKNSYSNTDHSEEETLAHYKDELDEKNSPH